MALTDTAIKKAKPAEKQYRLVDERGLVLVVRPNGKKLWQMRYRFDGKEKTASFGEYPDVSLSLARERRDSARATRASGKDPVATQKAISAAKAASAANSFEAVARDWWVHWKTSRTSTHHVAQTLRRLEADVFPAIGQRPISEISAPELVAMAKGVELGGASELARRSLQTCGQVFRYAIAHGKATRNPATDVKPSEVLKGRKAVNHARVGVSELPTLLRKIEAYQVTPATRLAMKLLAFTFVRTGELIGAKWSQFDLQAARWDIPAERMKMRTPHIVPLSPQAIEVLETLKTISGGRVILPICKVRRSRSHTLPWPGAVWGMPLAHQTS